MRRSQIVSDTEYHTWCRLIQIPHAKSRFKPDFKRNFCTKSGSQHFHLDEWGLGFWLFPGRGEPAASDR